MNNDANTLVSQELSHRIPEKINSHTKQQIEPKFILSGAQGPGDENHFIKATALKSSLCMKRSSELASLTPSFNNFC